MRTGSRYFLTSYSGCVLNVAMTKYLSAFLAFFFVVSPAFGACHSLPRHHDQYYRYRIVDGQRCWYAADRVTVRALDRSRSRSKLSARPSASRRDGPSPSYRKEVMRHQHHHTQRDALTPEQSTRGVPFPPLNPLWTAWPDLEPAPSTFAERFDAWRDR